MQHGDVDYLIIGQGLAGSALAWRLIQAGQRVRVIDDGLLTSASRVAAGLINPLAGMRFNRRPELDDWLASAQSWYRAIATVCGGAVLHATPMLRLLRSAEQQRFHARRLADPASTGLLGPLLTPGDLPEPVHAPFGAFVQHATGYVALPRLLLRLRDWLIARQAYETAHVETNDLELSADAVRLGPLTATRVVLCNGARLADVPWFRDLPLAPDKGELLTLRSRDWSPRHIVNGAHWLLPHDDGSLRFGATHDHHDRTPRITPQGRDRLVGGLAALVPGRSFEIVDQQAGVRPGTLDHYPLLGCHPAFPRLCVCNGFGARGALSIPWYTERLCRHLVDGDPLPAEADIRRFTA
jgi:glycine/D-amino acid oxidase-like deaminating enzyme